MVDNVEIDLGGMGWGYVDWIVLAQDSAKWRDFVNVAMKLRVL
jgi:hypothetical protein